MADYIYLLQTRLTPAQQQALSAVRDLARSRALTVFLVGGAVRDLTSGSPIRDLDVVVQGEALKLKKDLEKVGALIVGESQPTQSLHVHFPGGVRMEIGSTQTVTFPKPGKAVTKPSNILDDLRHRDFTANAMAISLNEGSYGLLMDPLNGVADIENRELRLVSNYGFIEDPSRMIRAARFGARLGWHMEEKTQARYETGKQEDYISALSPLRRAYETEEIIREEDPLRVLKRLESEGWMKSLSPVLQSAKVNEAELSRLRDVVSQLNEMRIYPDPSAAYFSLLTAKLAPKDVATLKSELARPGFAAQIDALEGETKAFAAQFAAKDAAAPSAAWKMLSAAVPEQVMWLAYTSKSAPVQARFKSYFTEWPQARQRTPYQLMQEMRITPEIPGYADLLETIFFAIMDGKMDTPEAARAFLEPFSPPAPPPPVNMRRRPLKRETKTPKSRSKKVAAVVAVDDDEDGVTLAASAAPVTDTVPAEVKKPAKAPKAEAVAAAVDAPVKAAAKAVAVKASPVKAAKVAPVKAAAKSAPVKVAAKAATKPAKKASVPVKVVAKKQPAKVAAKKPVKPAVKAKPAAKKVATKKVATKKVATKVVSKAKPAVKLAAKSKPLAKKVAVKAAKPAPSKQAAKKPVKPAAKKVSRR